jgi:hypothetical protein
MDAFDEVLFREGYGTPNALVKDWALLVALSRVDQYRAERDFFQKKYGMTIEEFEFYLHGDRGSENFDEEDDINDWEYSLKALKWWEKMVKDLQK